MSAMATFDKWLNPFQIESAIILTIESVDYVLIQTTITKYYFKGTPAQLAAQLAWSK